MKWETLKITLMQNSTFTNLFINISTDISRNEIQLINQIYLFKDIIQQAYIIQRNGKCDKKKGV